MARRGSGTKAEFLMLAHKFDPRKYHVTGWFMSDKLDGMRFFWDAGITRNMYADSVPWANTEKDSKRHLATGLWSRYGKVIHAPASWLDELPRIPLDGELYLGPQQWQALTSIVRAHNSSSHAWSQVGAAIFDSPSYAAVFSDRDIDNRPNYTKSLRGVLPWALSKAIERNVLFPPDEAKLSFHLMVRWLHRRLAGNPVAYAHEQIQLEHTTPQAMAQIETKLAEVIEGRGEGLILRKHTSIWMPTRSHEMLKYKPFEDAEATCIGYTWGRETDRGSKLLGMMGAMICDFAGTRFELSGFKESERQMVQLGPSEDSVINEPFYRQGEQVSEHWANRMFPIGTRISFRYRELSDTGVPKEGRFLRKWIDA
jgi:DNA ligase-1